jgi:streptogramin lyase
VEEDGDERNDQHVAFAPDGKTLAAGDATVRYGSSNPRTGRVRRAVHLLGGGPEFAVFAPDGTLATGNEAGIVQRWSGRTGAQIGHPALVVDRACREHLVRPGRQEPREPRRVGRAAKIG